MTDTDRAIACALVHLAAARDLLKCSKAQGAVAKVRAAITSSQKAALELVHHRDALADPAHNVRAKRGKFSIG